MQKEALVISILILLLLVPFSQAQLNYIEIKDVNVNDNAIQVLIQNNFDQDFNKEIFIINSQYEIIQEEILRNFTSKFFIINYPNEIKLNNLQVIINDQTASYIFTGNEDKFIINQEASSASELVQTQESNSPISYIYSAGRVAKIQDNNIIYFSSDNIGSTSLETDSTGSISFKANYLPFGKELSFSSIGIEKYGFTSKEYDYESNLNYFNARYYNPSNGKFISNDPIYKVNEGGYQYVRNNPLTITDPSGTVSASIQADRGYGRNDDAYIKNSPIQELWDANYAPIYPGQNPGERMEAFFDIGTGLFGIGAGAIPGISGISQQYSYGKSRSFSEDAAEIIRGFGSVAKTFRNSKFVGRGSMGEVRRTVSKNGLSAAIKRSVNDDYSDMYDFNMENSVLGRLHGYGLSGRSGFTLYEGGKIYLIKEYVAGRALNRQSVTKEAVLNFVESLGRYDQENPGMTVWDIGLQNLAVTRKGNIMIIDPGVTPLNMRDRIFELNHLYDDIKFKGDAPSKGEYMGAYQKGYGSKLFN